MVICPYCGNTITSSSTDGSYYCGVCQKNFWNSATAETETARFYSQIPYHKFTDTVMRSIQIECNAISLKHKDLDIEVCLDRAIGDVDSITINGIKFVREK